ncbi:MAG: hypothetical protein J6O49_02910, partial [Bacteroidaceae bacterium]|nr:hypothetical protein [Bacteroidaceae bacterium]
MTIQEIFDNIDQYSNNIDDLVRWLKSCGVNTFDDFRAAARTEGVPIKKSMQDQVAAKYASSDDDDWQKACDNDTEPAYQEYLDTYPEGKHRSEARSAIAAIQQQEDIDQSELEWDNVDKNDVKKLQDYINRYPTSPLIQEAKRLIHNLRREQYLGVDIKALEKQIKAIRTNTSINNPERAIFDRIVSYLNSGKITVNDLLTAIEEDNNFISGAVANLLWESGYITDFSSTGIDSDFIAHMMSNVTPQAFTKPEPIDRITKSPCTEVYFWGIPSSGKSCALGAILSAAKNGRTARSMQQDPDCQGYGYMTRLSNLFRSNSSVGTLPEGTAISSTYEMGFILEDEDGKEHPITCIDLAGELVRCMYKQDAGEPLTTEQEQVLKTLTDILIDNRTKNRKIHFFVIEYGAEDREYEGLPQQDYLAAAVAYIQRTGIFQKDTDGLYLLVTKVDKAKAVGKELQEKLKAYISENYQGFYNGLKKICKDNEINGGKVDIQPFTLG